MLPINEKVCHLPQQAVDDHTRVFHCRPCLNMVGDGHVTMVWDHGVLSALDLGTLPTVVAK